MATASNVIRFDLKFKLTSVLFHVADHTAGLVTLVSKKNLDCWYGLSGRSRASKGAGSACTGFVVVKLVTCDNETQKKKPTDSRSSSAVTWKL
jgi:hypothetical protein